MNGASGRSTTKTFHYITLSKTWAGAKSYCYYYYTDLAVIANSEEDKDVFSKMSNMDPSWIGFYRDVWRWSDGSYAKFRAWSPSQPVRTNDSELCIMLQPDGYVDTNCDEVHPFFCNRGERRITDGMCCLYSL